MPVEDVDTQQSDEQVTTGDEQVTDSGTDGGDSADQGDGADGYFLNVDERTRYKTREEAVKGFQNAGQRIAELSAWEKEIGERFDVHDPQQVASILEEYIQIKEAQASAAANKDSGKGEQATHTVDLSKLTPKEREAFAWLQKVAPELGYVPKSELKALQDKIASIESGLGDFSASQTAQKVSAGKSQITQLLTSAKLPTDPEFASFIEDSMAAWIKADAKRTAQWVKGQNINALLSDAFKVVKGNLDRLNVKNAASYQGSRQGGGNKAPISRLPQQGQALRKAGPGTQKAGKPKPTSADLHNAAWALANKRWGGASDDSGE